MTRLADVAGAAREVEQLGYDGCWTAEISHDPFLPLTLAAEHTSTVELGQHRGRVRPQPDDQ